MRVLGIDPGSRFLGFGVVEEQRGKLSHVGHGVIRAGTTAPLEQRLQTLFLGLREAVSLYRPDAVAVEGLFTCKNARSALILGHARGVALLVAAQTGLPVHEYAPARVKKSVGAGGASGKDAVARMVFSFLGLTEVERFDATDALAVAICHLNSSRLGTSAGSPKSPRSPRRKNGFGSLTERLRPSYQRFVAER